MTEKPRSYRALKIFMVTVSLSLSIIPGVNADEKQNEDLVVKAITGLFIKRDPSVIEKYWSETYKQHNPGIPDGRGDLKGIVASLTKEFRYEMGFVTTNKEGLVMVHGRYTGWGPKSLVGVDIFRIKDGKLEEHWDVLQEEVKTKSGRPMFEPNEAKH